jgi:uncharacterized metal-binding protein YceD (DUF177 family)
VNFSPALVTEVQPLELKGELPAAALELQDQIARAEAPIQVELMVQRDGENLLVTGTVVTTLTAVCGRCGTWMPWPVRTRVDHLFDAPHPASIDLTPLLREDILIELPLNAACHLGADGRCPVTGEFYQPPPVDTGTLVTGEVWEALSQIKTKN